MNLLIVFVKAPVPGRVKTRLVPPLTHEAAATLYCEFVQTSLRLARALPEIVVRVAYDPAPSHPDLSWLPDPPAWFPQAGGDLGARLIHAFGAGFAAGADRVVIIGSDSPDLPRAHLEEAFARLAGGPAALGPAEDGGYYLIGLRRDAPPNWPDLFRRIPWSGPRVADATRTAARCAGIPVALLPPWRDIDRPEDLARLSGHAML